MAATSVGSGIDRVLADQRAAERLEDAAAAAMRVGLAHLRRGAAAAGKALKAFEMALAYRSCPSPSTSRRTRYALAGTWINIATARLWRGLPADPDAAVTACDAALALLAGLDRSHAADVPRRRAIAHHTRGRALGIAPAQLERAGEAFAASLRVLASPDARHLGDRTYLAAASWVALADVEARRPQRHAAALAAAARALQLVRGSEADDLRAAEVGLLARHVCCRAVAGELEAGRGRPLDADDHVHVATDAADDGLALARRWERRGEVRFQPIADDLARFGAGVYARYQPHFLDEFLRDARGGPTAWAP